MYLCYLDESGTSDIPGNTSHYVLAGLSIPIWHWKDADSDIRAIKRKYWLREVEIHTAWMLRPYLEQRSILDFESLAYAQRRLEVERLRNAELYRLQRSNNPKRYQQTRKNFRKTEAYIHLTYEERRAIIVELAASVSSWGFARLFAECVDKLHFDPSRTGRTIDEQSFEQVVSRFQQFLRVTGKTNDVPNYGLLIHDNNETVARRHTRMMRDFHKQGTLWTSVENIIETPLFVDSQLTDMVQIADLCSYALRRYLENQEEELFEHVFQRADRRKEIVVGVRHFSGPECKCRICAAHRY